MDCRFTPLRNDAASAVFDVAGRPARALACGDSGLWGGRGLSRSAATGALFTLLLWLGLCTVAQARIYKWVDANGATHFSDGQPHSGKVETVEIRINTYSSPEITDPDATVGVSKEVVMYGASWCGVCKRAEAWFHQQGIPFKEYDVETSAIGRREFRRLGGTGVPIILVGERRMNGFDPRSFERLYGNTR